jgi:uncharacterized membrane protein
VKKYLLAGLLVWTPLAITIWVLSWLLGAMDGVFAWVLSGPQALLPTSAHDTIERLRHVPGLGVVVMIVGLLLTGVFVTNIFGQWSQAACVLDQKLVNIGLVDQVFAQAS